MTTTPAAVVCDPEDDWRDDYDDEVLDVRPGDAYCDYCEVDGHSFGSCPRRDDAS